MKLLKENTNILAIETSCDETAASVLRGSLKSVKPKFSILSSVVHTQINIHKKTGGVVPEVAARAHMKYILPATEKALADSKCALSNIDYIAVTSGPGLIVSLIVGTEFAKGLSLAAGIPLLPTNHMSGHLYSAFMSESASQFPMLSIIVSGGHTMFVLMKDYKNYRVIGSTVDDAAGEAFDKVARLLELPYPGGPAISKLARLGKTDIGFPRPMIHHQNFQFSFSGLKTAVLYYLDTLKKPISHKQKADIAMSFQNAVVDVLTAKAERAIAQFECKSVALSGGVAANAALRNSLNAMCKQKNILFAVPNIELCTDNAQMIAIAAYFNLRNGQKPVPAGKVRANPSWELK